MDRLNALAVFKTVVEHRSFVRAADALGLTPPMVTRRVQELEAMLGVRLVHRSARYVAATSVGDEVLVLARRLLADYDELESIGRLSVSQARGTVRLAAPDFYARRYLGTALASYIARHPQVSIDLRLRDAGICVLDGNVDLALCLERDLRPSLVARRVAVAPVSPYAAPGYLDRKGVPEHPSDLDMHECLSWDGSRSGTFWRFRHVASGEQHSVAARGGLHSTNAEVLVHAAAQGAGVVIVPVCMVEEAVASGRLLPLLPKWRAEPLSLHLAYHSRDHQPLSVRRLVDHLAGVLGEQGGQALPLHMVESLSVQQ
jgi:DNA-binding transcriptional LysR family regulator